MVLHVPNYQPLPAPDPKQPLITVPIAALRPTQLCVGLAVVIGIWGLATMKG